MQHSGLVKIKLYAGTKTFLYVRCRGKGEYSRIGLFRNHNADIDLRQRCRLQHPQQRIRRQKIRCLYIHPLYRLPYCLYIDHGYIAPVACRAGSEQLHIVRSDRPANTVRHIGNQRLAHKTPVNSKRILQAAYGRALYAQMGIAPSRSQVTVSHVHTPDIAHNTVNYHYFTVITPIYTRCKGREVYTEKRVYLYTGICHSFEKAVFSVDRAYMVVNYPYLNTLGGTLYKQIGQPGTGFVALYYIILQQYVFARTGQIREKRLKFIPAISKYLHGTTLIKRHPRH